MKSVMSNVNTSWVSETTVCSTLRVIGAVPVESPDEKNMDKQYGILIKKKALEAIGHLDSIVSDIRGHCSDEEFEKVRRGVGLSIAGIVDMVLEPIFEEFPEIDDDRLRK